MNVFSTFFLVLLQRYLQRASLFLHSTLSVKLAVLGGLLLFVALHSSFFVLSVLFPDTVIEVVYFLAMIVMFEDSIYHVMVGAGTASLLTTHRTSFWVPSLIVSKLTFGINKTLWTSTVNQFNIEIIVYCIIWRNFGMISSEQLVIILWKTFQHTARFGVWRNRGTKYLCSWLLVQY